jgi:N utilization substance protein A
VPEIYDDTVVIKSAVREPGDRAKIAVASNEKDVDPVGACVGMKGSRVQSIIKELRGEKIDIIEWSDEPSVFAANALSPAKVSQVRITDINKRKMHVIVGEDQLSLAIGKKGQNVRLATRLVGWDIDIVSEDVLKKEIAQQMGRMMASGEAVPLTAIGGVTPNQADTLAEKGIEDVEKLAATSVDDLVEILDVSLDEAQEILNSASAIVQAKDADAEAPAGAEAESGEPAEAESAEQAAPTEEAPEAAEPAAEADEQPASETGDDAAAVDEAETAVDETAAETAVAEEPAEAGNSETEAEETSAKEDDASTEV